MKKKQRTKKAKEIKAEQYDENEELDVEIEIEDDYYEDDENLGEEEITDVENKTFTDISTEDIDEIEEYEDAKKTFKRANADKFMKIFNIIFVLLMVIMIFIAIDVICVTRFNIGPFFAIKTNTYKDGGTKVYHGIGYKVIKYNVLLGRQDTQIGFWNMPYSTTPTQIDDIDLAIEFQNNPEKTANKYYKQYLQINSEIKAIDTEENKIVLQYVDPDGKYTLEIDCPMASNKDELMNYTEQQKVSVRGTVYKFTIKDAARANTIYLSDCFADQVVEESE